MAHYPTDSGDVRPYDVHENPGRVRFSRRHGISLHHGHPQRRGSPRRLQLLVGSHRGSALRNHRRTGSHRGDTLDGEKGARHAVVLHRRHCAPHAARGGDEFRVEQHDGGGAVRQGGEAVGEETQHRPLETPHTAQLRVVSRWHLHPDRHAAEPHNIGYAAKRQGYRTQHLQHHAARTVLSRRRSDKHHSDEEGAAGAQVARRGSGSNRRLHGGTSRADRQPFGGKDG